MVDIFQNVYSLSFRTDYNGDPQGPSSGSMDSLEVAAIVLISKSKFESGDSNIQPDELDFSTSNLPLYPFEITPAPVGIHQNSHPLSEGVVIDISQKHQVSVYNLWGKKLDIAGSEQNLNSRANGVYVTRITQNGKTIKKLTSSIK